MLVLARVGGLEIQGEVLERLNYLPFGQLDDAFRTYGLVFIRMGGRRGEMAESVLSRLALLFLSLSEPINRKLCRLLVYLEAPDVIDKSLQLLRKSQTQQRQMFYISTLGRLKNRWTVTQRKVFFSWLNLAEKKYLGGTKALGRSELTIVL